MSRRLSDRFGVVGALTLCAGMALGLAGCKSAPTRPRKVNASEAVNTGLSRIGDDPGLALPRGEALMEKSPEKSSIQAQIEESARQLSVYFANLEMDGPAAVPEDRRVVREVRPGTSVAVTPAPQENTREAGPSPTQGASRIAASDINQPNHRFKDDGSGVRVSLLGAAGSDSEASTAEGSGEGPDADPVPAPAATPDEPKPDQSSAPEPEAMDPVQRRDKLVRELAGVLGELAASGDDPGSAALALATLETILPEDVDDLVDEGVLSDAERASLDAARELLSSMRSRGSIASPAAVSEKLDEIKAQLDRWAGLTIKRAALCTSVQGYGRYETFPSYRFIAGRAQEVIVYTELERFAQRETTGPDGLPRYETSLSQRLELYHVADDLNTWNRAAESVNDETRNRLRDYYLINQVRLPGNLGVGRYHLKIVMRDLISDKVAETIIPIEIVAH